MFSNSDILKMSVKELRMNIRARGGYASRKANSRVYLEKYLLELCASATLNGIVKPKPVRATKPYVL